MRLGEGPATDLLAIGVSATDYVGHTYGTQGSEMCIQLLALDRALGDFFAELDATGIDYVVVLTADHGGIDMPERDREHGVPRRRAGRRRAQRRPRWARRSPRRLGLQGPVLLGDGRLRRHLCRPQPDRAPTRARALAAAIAAYRAHPQVAAVFTRDEIAAAPAPSGPPETWTLLERARA